MKILHFENDELLSKMYGQKFIDANFSYVCSPMIPDKAEALIELVSKESPNLIIMDIIFSGIGTEEAVRILKANKATQAIPIFGLSNFVQEEDIRIFIDAGMNDYIIRSTLAPDEFVGRIKSYLSNSKKNRLNYTHLWR